MERNRREPPSSMEHASSSEALAEPEDTARDESLQQSSDLGQAFKWFVGDCREGRRLHSTTFGPVREQGCSRPAFRFVEGPHGAQCAQWWGQPGRLFVFF